MKAIILSRGSYLYSTQSLFRAFRKAHHFSEIVDFTKVSAIQTAHQTELLYLGEPFEDVDAVLGRIGPVYTDMGASLISRFQSAGAYVAPTPQALTLARDKWMALGALQEVGVPVPHSAIVNDFEDLDHAVNILGGYPIIVKLLESTHGAGVMLANDRQSALSLIDAFTSLNKAVMIQKFIKESKGSDIRVIVCDGEVVAAMQRLPAKGEFRSNLHRGGQGKKVKLSIQEQEVAIASAKAIDLDYTGVDILRSNDGPMVLEVNASPGLEGIENVTGIDVAGAIVKMVEKKVKDKWKAQ